MSEPEFLQPLEGMAVAVVGAGMAGLTAARRLARAGAIVTVFEKEADVGGRLATYKSDFGAADYGAQYMTAREPAFKALAARAKVEGTLVPWSPTGKDSEDEWLIGMPGMIDFAYTLVDGFKVLTGHAVREIRESGKGFVLTFADGTRMEGFERVVVALPGPFAASLLQPFGAPFIRLRDAVFGPCWTLIIVPKQPVDPGFDVCRDVEALAWLARSASKPGRQGACWVAQANPSWSRGALDEDEETVRRALLPMVEKSLGRMDDALFIHVHLWRHALLEKAVGETFLLSEDGRIGACGDTLIAPRVESAWLSGRSLAEAMIAKGSASS